MKKVDVPEFGTTELLAEICSRSANGEWVRDILTEKGLPIMPTLRWLRDHHHEDMKAAKQEQNRRKKEKEDAGKTNP